MFFSDLSRDTFDGIEHGVFDLGDFVPSSNPSSQEDFGQDLSPVDLDTKDVPLEKEIFKKENLQDWLPSCVGKQTILYIEFCVILISHERQL